MLQRLRETLDSLGIRDQNGLDAVCTGANIGSCGHLPRGEPPKRGATPILLRGRPREIGWLQLGARWALVAA